MVCQTFYNLHCNTVKRFSNDQKLLKFIDVQCLKLLVNPTKVEKDLFSHEVI